MIEDTDGYELSSGRKAFLSRRAAYIALACFSAKSPITGNLYICP